MISHAPGLPLDPELARVRGHARQQARCATLLDSNLASPSGGIADSLSTASPAEGRLLTIKVVIALAVFLLVFWIGAVLARLAQSRPDSRVDAPGSQPGEKCDREGFWRGLRLGAHFGEQSWRDVLDEGIHRVGGSVLSLASKAMRERLGDESRLCQDLYLRRSIDPEAWVGARWLLFVLLAFVCGLMLSLGGSVWRFLLFALCGALAGGLFFALLLPRLLLAELRSLLQNYRKRLLLRLPGIVDLWAIGLESGQAVGAAFVQAASQLTDPLTKPVQMRVIRDMKSGMSLSESLHRLGRGLGMRAISQLGVMVSLSAAQGAPLAEPMKSFAMQLRQDLYLAAENHAMKAPLRLLLPLVLLIFPSTFIVLLFPVLYRVQQEFAR